MVGTARADFSYRVDISLNIVLRAEIIEITTYFRTFSMNDRHPQKSVFEKKRVGMTGFHRIVIR